MLFLGERCRDIQKTIRQKILNFNSLYFFFIIVHKDCTGAFYLCNREKFNTYNNSNKHNYEEETF